jgi:large subunit ribosomal protein L24
MATMKIKRGDMVRVISGAERDNEGKVIAVDRKKHRVYVEGVHMIKKHVKPSIVNQNGGIIEQAGPIDISNVMLLVDGETTRVGFKFENGKKVRYAKKTGKVID